MQSFILLDTDSDGRYLIQCSALDSCRDYGIEVQVYKK